MELDRLERNGFFFRLDEEAALRRFPGGSVARLALTSVVFATLRTQCVAITAIIPICASRADTERCARMPSGPRYREVADATKLSECLLASIRGDTAVRK